MNEHNKQYDEIEGADIGAGSGDVVPHPEEKDFLKGKQACDPKNFKDCESCQ